MSMRQTSWLVRSGWLVLAAGALVAALHDVDVERALALTAAANPTSVAALVGAFALNHALRVVRFARLLDADVPLSSVGRACLVGFAAMVFFPLRTGEAVRPAWLARDGVPLASSAAAVVSERVLDVAAWLVFLAWASTRPHVIEALTIGDVSMVHGGIVAATSLLAGVAVAAMVATRVPGRFPRLADIAARTAASIRSAVSSPISLAWTAAIWSTSVLYVALGLRALPGLPHDIEAAVVTWTAIVSGAALLPTPGLLGTYEVAARAGLATFDVDGSAAAAFGVGMHAAYVLFLAVTAGAILLTKARGSRFRRPPDR